MPAGLIEKNLGGGRRREGCYAPAHKESVLSSPLWLAAEVDEDVGGLHLLDLHCQVGPVGERTVTQ